MKKLLSIVDNSGVQQKAVITESVSAPAVSKTEQYFKAVNNEVLQNIKEQQAQKKIEVKRVVSRVLEKLDEGKTTKDKPAVRNFVAKNAPKAGAGAHKDKKKAEKQGDTKHKKELVPMDEERTEVRDKDGNVTSWKDEGEWKKSTANKDGRGKVTNLSDKARRETEKLSKKEKNLAEDRDGNEVEEFLHKVAQSGDNGFDMLYNAQQGKYGREIERAVQDMYDDISIDTGYHGDDDFEQIYDRMLDNIEADYGQQGMTEVAGAQKCWPGHRKVGTQSGTGKNAGKPVNKCKKIEEGRFGKDAYERDQANAEYGMNGEFKRDFKRQEMEHELGHETNNYAVAINGKTWKVFGTRNHAESVARKIQMRDPNKKVSVHETGSPVSEQLAESAYGSIKVGSPVTVYSNVLKKSVFGKVVDLKEGRAYVQYNNTKIVMGHPISEVAAAAPAAKVAGSVGGKMASRLIPGVGGVVGAYDAYDRAKKGDYIGAGLSGLGAVTSFIPGIGTAATMGLAGAQLARDYKVKTGVFAPDEAEAGQAATPAAGKGTIPNPTKYPTTPDEIKAFQQAKGLTVDGVIGKNTRAALAAAGIKPPAQAATPAPSANVGAAVRAVAPAAGAIAKQALK
jgi:hypothetical protein